MWQNIPWQEVIVGICVITAVLFLVRRWIFPSAKKSAACGGCGGCAKTSESSCANPIEKESH
jgi:hypothetical protein